MTELAHAIPAEKEQPDKSGLQEKRHQPFDRQRRAEDVADIMRVVGPVGAELEFHGDAGGHPHGEIDAEQLAPEPRHVAPDLAPGHDVSAFHDGEQERQPERQRHEQKVIERSDRELQPRQTYRIEVLHGVLFLSFTAAATGRAGARPSRRRPPHSDRQQTGRAS